MRRNKLAIALADTLKPSEAEAEHRTVLAARERFLGAEHPDTLGSRYNLALSLRLLKRPEDAQEEMEAAYAGIRKVLGDGHSNAAKAKELLELLEELKKELTEQ